MQYQCRPAADNGMPALNSIDALLADFAVTADDGVLAFRNGDIASVLVPIEHYDYVLPFVAACIVL